VGLAFALDALGRLFRILRRCRAALEQGYTPATLLRVLADRHRDMGFLLSGARHFSMVDAREREGLVTMRVAGWLLMCAAGIWLLAAMAVGLLAAARETIAPLPLQVIAFFPAGVLYAAGALTMLLQEDRVRRARRLWYKQPWSADLSEKEVREYAEAWRPRRDLGRCRPRPDRRASGSDPAPRFGDGAHSDRRVDPFFRPLRTAGDAWRGVPQLPGRW